MAGGILCTARKAKTALELLGEVPTAWALHPQDVETIELARDSLERFYGDGPFQAGPETLWGLPRVSCLGVPQGFGVLADWSQITLLVRDLEQTLAATQATVVVDGTPVDLWSTNQVVLRSEGRYGLKIWRPQAFAIVDLVEGSSSS